MAELTVDMVYGQALFDAARNRNKIALIAEEGSEMNEIFRREPDFMAYLSAPTVPAGEKKEAVEKVFSGRVSEELENLLYVLIDKRRAGHFERIVKRMQYLIRESEGFTGGTVYSAFPLSGDQMAALEEQTGKLLNMRVKLENETDPGIIGGVKILVEGKIIDASLRSQLKRLGDGLKM